MGGSVPVCIYVYFFDYMNSSAVHQNNDRNRNLKKTYITFLSKYFYEGFHLFLQSVKGTNFDFCKV